jgi:hypothetical protein
MTFVLVVDVLGRLISAATTAGVLALLHPRREIPRISMYPDDVILFCRPTPHDLTATKESKQVKREKEAAPTLFHLDATTLVLRSANDAIR